jgi:hypothetical protein
MYGSSPGNANVGATPAGGPVHPPTTNEHRSFDNWEDGNGHVNNIGSNSTTQPKDIPVRSKPTSNPQQYATSPVGTSSQYGASPALGKEDLTSRYGERERAGSERPPHPARVKTDDEETVVEKMWQPLFDSDNRSTTRLSQFLRGIALHLTEEFEPKHSLVIGPKKMRKFYELMKIPEEAFPWSSK